MNHEQLAFFNQQLAAMLQSGLPLESSLKQLSASMRRGPLRTEVERLEADLAQGAPLEEALERRELPELYVAMLRAGIRGHDLSGVLTLAADYYGNLHRTWLRLKGLLVYPGIVLVTSLLVSGLLAVMFTQIVHGSASAFAELLPGRGSSLPVMLLQTWIPVVLLGLTTLAFFCVLSVRSVRHFARWKLPGFREASLSQLASTLSVMLEHGADLGAALDVAQQNEVNSSVRRELAAWKTRLANGAQRFADIARPGRLVPPLFVWLVAGAGENWARGFRRAADTYDARAKYRIELALYAALPVTIILVAALIGTELTPLVKGFADFMNSMVHVDGFE